MKIRSALLGLALLSGCSSAPPQKSEPVAVSGVVLLPNGKPAGDVSVNFLPTSSSQMQGAAALKADGKFTAQLTPGKYTYNFEGRSIAAIPTKYHTNSLDHSFEVPAGGLPDLTIKLN